MLTGVAYLKRVSYKRTATESAQNTSRYPVNEGKVILEWLYKAVQSGQ